ncbi:MAG: DUF3990 domain-containing protein [Bacteroidales bacterium]|nr:DUF3990 domain-containing protein [Candidatus Cacconaster scatequi]
MKVYHGSLEIVTNPEIRISDRTLDYGSGFYTTTDYAQARSWVERRKNDGVDTGYINVYEISKEAILVKKTLWFDSPSEEWVDFVHKNRTDRNFKHDFDFVYGPVANDKVYAAFALFEDGLINKQELIAELKTYVLVDQLLLHSSEALACLSYIEAIKIEL